MRRRLSYKKNPLRLRLKQKTLQALSGVILILIALLIFLSFFGNEGLASILRNRVVDLFGWSSLFVPLILFICGLLLSKVNIPFIQINAALGASGLLLASVILTSSFARESSGILGNNLWLWSSGLFSPIGAFLITALIWLIFLLILFNTSLETTISLLTKAFSTLFKFSKSTFLRRERVINKETVFIERKETNIETKPKLSTTELVVSNTASDEVWEYPPLDILNDSIGGKATRGDLKHSAALIEKTLESFGIQAKVVEVNSGPAVTQYALEIALGTKLTKITALANDIALALAAPTGTVRIEAPIPGKSLVGIEVPNVTPEIVPLKKILISEKMQRSKSKLSLALGLDVSGNAVVDDLARMPHVLIAGATGSGKSVAINSFIANLLFRTTPNEVKLVLIDPKIVELSQWNGITHLLTPVIIEPEKVLSALKWSISEMERRYKLFAQVSAKNIDQYNEASGFQALPYIVIIIDELADLMMFAPVEIEDSVCRLAQMSRAVGIHLILATQRPSVDVLTGLIKANIPCRISFNVTSQVDSRVIIDQVGAEKLLGRGDMLYVPPDASKPQRIQGAYVSEPEISKLIEFLKKSGVAPQYTEEIISMPISKISGKSSGDELFEEAVRVVCQYDRASASLLQRRLRVGYARAARLLDELEASGIVGVADGAKARDVLIRDPEKVLSQISSGE